MSFSTFRKKVGEIALAAGSRVRFSSENGRHIARCSGGVTITGNTTCRKITVKWGNGHIAVAQV